MMKLYYATGACSHAPHIVLHEAGLPFESERVDLRSKKTESGADFQQINSKGYVPALVLDSGELLTEVAAIVQYLADLVPEKHLAPPAGTLARVRLQEWLSFISSEVHKSFSPLFRPMPEEAKQAARERIEHWFGWLDAQLAGRSFLMGEQFTVADTYLYAVANWSKMMKIPLANWPHLAAYLGRIAARPSVQAARKIEGL